MQQIGYSLVDATGKELQFFGDTAGQFPSIPDVIKLSNGDFVHCAALGQVLADGSKLVLRQLVDAPPAPWYTPTGVTITFDGTQTIKTVVYGQQFDPNVLANTINAECSRRIYAVASATTQQNMIGNAAAGLLSAADMTTYQTAVGWIASTVAACRALITAADATYADDSHWPACSAAVLALVANY
jgi:hypothetical protein